MGAEGVATEPSVGITSKTQINTCRAERTGDKSFRADEEEDPAGSKPACIFRLRVYASRALRVSEDKASVSIAVFAVSHRPQNTLNVCSSVPCQTKATL